MDYSNFYDQLMKFYGKFSSLLPFGLVLPPIRCTIEVTYGCNLRCLMCYQQKERKSKRKKAELTKREIKKIIDQMLPKTLITLTGGEFLIREDALELIDYATRRHYCNLVTNATLVNPKVAKKLVENKVLLVGVSLDGLGQFHDKIRGVSGSFKKGIAGIKLIQQEKARQKKRFPLIDIKTLILPDNTNQLYPLYQLAQKLKVDFLTFSSLKGSTIQFSPPILDSLPKNNEVKFFKRGKFNLDWLEAQIKKITQEKSSVKLRFYPRGLNCLLGKYYQNQITPQDYSPCYFPWSGFNVSPHGDVFPCLSLKVGNLKEKNINQIWNGKKMRQFRLKLKKAKVFSACHGCCYSHLPYQRYLRPFKK